MGRMAMAVTIAVVTGLCVAGSARADAPVKSSETVKRAATPLSVPSAVAAAEGPGAAPRSAQGRDQGSAAPFNPRWKVRSWTISGLTVWTFRPGHFVRN